MRLTLFLIILISICSCTDQPAHKNISDQIAVLLDSSEVISNQSPATNGSLPSNSMENYSITKAMEADFTKAKKAYTSAISYDTIQYKKRGGIIQLPTEGDLQPVVCFEDTLSNTDDTERKEFEYIGQFKKIGLYIVVASYYETGEVYIVNKRTGEKTMAWNIPESSPNDSYIANLSAGYGMDGVPNGIQIWHVDNSSHFNTKRISKIVELDQNTWVPFDFVWETDTSLLLKVTAVDTFLGGRPNANDYYYLRLTVLT